MPARRGAERFCRATDRQVLEQPQQGRPRVAPARRRGGDGDGRAEFVQGLQGRRASASRRRLPVQETKGRLIDEAKWGPGAALVHDGPHQADPPPRETSELVGGVAQLTGRANNPKEDGTRPRCRRPSGRRGRARAPHEMELPGEQPSRRAGLRDGGPARGADDAAATGCSGAGRSAQPRRTRRLDLASSNGAMAMPN